jgi:hypothetical protein
LLPGDRVRIVVSALDPQGDRVGELGGLSHDPRRSREVNVTANTLRTDFHRLIQRCRPFAGGVKDADHEIRNFDAACWFGKYPRALGARRIHALRLSIAFAE